MNISIISLIKNKFQKMFKNGSTFLFLLLLISCVSYDPSRKSAGDGSNPVVNYSKDRVMDLRDTFTLTATGGVVGGFKLQLGPIGLGAYFEGGGGGHGSLAFELGLRNGEFGDHYTYDSVLLYGFDSTSPSDDSGRGDRRGKSYSRGSYNEQLQNPTPSVLKRPHTYTRIGFAIGLLGGIRFEINPGEILDFLVGFTTLDIFQDDIYLRDKKE